MKKTFLLFTLAFLSFTAFGAEASAQRSIEPQTQQRDPVLEADSTKNLDVARHYFTTKKAYKAVILRAEEIVAANPMFAKMDEVLYLIGMSSFYLSENKGKQKIDFAKASEEDKKRFAPEKLREDALANLSMLVEKYPNSEFKEKAQKTIKELESKPAGK